MDLNNLTDGLYETLLTQLMANQVDPAKQFIGQRQLDEHEVGHYLAAFLSRVIQQSLRHLPNKEKDVSAKIAFANDLIAFLAEKTATQDIDHENQLAPEGKLLTAVFSKTDPIAADLKIHSEHIRPATGLAQSELFSGNKAEVSLESELKKEILSSDEICWVVSFIKWTGIRIFENELRQFTSSGKKLRIITTSYMGATDQKAIDFLASLPNTEVKINYNTDRERLHAKSYIFHRKSGFDTAYIGSSNLSKAAVTSGLEWNIKITSQEIPHIVQKTQKVFETLWSSEEFEHYQANHEPHSKKLAEALSSEKNTAKNVDTYFFTVKPFDYQQEILERLKVERQTHQRYRNLVVAATGTGKTIISAFDFRRFLADKPAAKILFVAHREEILRQAQAAYRGVLARPEFGELWCNGNKPSSYRELFATVQTLNNQLANINLSKDYFDYIVIDEVHHIAASSYRQILNYFEPQILLGLTATPERHDGASILDDFCNTIAAEIRLPEAINRGLLTPFQYFGIDDDTDLSKVSWRNGRYAIEELSNILTNNDARAKRIIEQLTHISTDVSQIRALAFCVSKQHAEYMNKRFNERNIASDILTSDNSNERHEKLQDLRSKKINILCVVDMFNEGVDIPEVDTLLFLRPTESLTIFLQQLGRGLRLFENKACCTILDFVGNSRPEYNQAQKFRALIGKSNKSINQEIDEDFQHLPLGCHIELSRKAKDIILRNIKQATTNAKSITRKMSSFGNESTLTLNLQNFLKTYPEISIDDIYSKSAKSWSRLIANINSSAQAIDDAQLTIFELGMRTRITQCDDRDYLLYLRDLAKNNFQSSMSNNPYALLAHYDFYQQSGTDLGYKTAEQSLAALANEALAEELVAATELLLDRTSCQHFPMPYSAYIPLKVHARYSREQILVSFGVNSFSKRANFREGVLDIKDQKVFLLFVTLNKSEKHFSPSTMYQDFALSESLFHWQPQNATRPDKGRGKTLIEHQDNGYRIFLFVREASKDSYDRTTSYVNFGEVFYQSHTYEHSVMNITLRLAIPLPMFIWHDAAKLTAA